MRCQVCLVFLAICIGSSATTKNRAALFAPKKSWCRTASTEAVIGCKPHQENPWDVSEYHPFSALGLLVSGIGAVVVAIHFEFQFTWWNSNPREARSYSPVALTCATEFGIWLCVLAVASVFELNESSMLDFREGGSHLMHARVYENDPVGDGDMLHTNISNVEHLQLYFFWLIAATTAFAELRHCAPGDCCAALADHSLSLEAVCRALRRRNVCVLLSNEQLRLARALVDAYTD